MHIAIIGGSDAGISAALRAREVDGSAEITVFLADGFANYSICGSPFYLSGATPNWRDLAHRTEFGNISLQTDHIVRGIDIPEGNLLVEHGGVRRTVSYDRLVIATGATPARPPIEGLNLPGVFALHTMNDSFRVQQYVTESNPKTAIIIGAGYLGMEMADAFTRRGINASLIGRGQTVFPSVDPELGIVIEHELARSGVNVVNGTEARAISRSSSGAAVKTSTGRTLTASFAILTVGVTPASTLAKDARIALGPDGAIAVDRRMRTAAPNIYAAGDCAQTWDRLLEHYAYLPLGTTSHKQGRVAGENAAGGNREFAGSVRIQVVKIFDLAVGRTGLTEAEALRAGFDAMASGGTFLDHKAYYPGVRELQIRITGDPSTGRLLGHK